MQAVTTYLALLQHMSELEACVLQQMQWYRHLNWYYSAEINLESIVEYNFSRTYHSNDQFGQTSEIDLVFLSYSKFDKVKFKMYACGKYFGLSKRVIMVLVYHGYEDIAEKFFKLMWQYNFLNAVLILSNLQVYTFTPVWTGFCNDISVVNLGHCQGVAKIDFPKVRLDECTMRVYATIQLPFFDSNDLESNQGYEAGILRLLLEALNIRATFEIGHGYVQDDPNVDLLCGRFTAQENQEMVTYSSNIEIATFVPIAKRIAPWKNLLSIFDSATWIALLLSIIALSFTWTAIFRNIADSFMFTLSSLISSAPNPPKKYRPFFLIWLVSSLILTNSYIGLLTSLIFKPVLDAQISTIHELVTNNFNICDGTYFHDYIRPLLQDYPKYQQYCNSFEGLFHEKFAYASETRLLHYNLRSSNLYLHKFNSVKTMLAFWNRQRSIYTTKIQLYLYRIIDVGLVQNTDVYNKQVAKPVFTSEFEKISLEHLYLIFTLHAVGILISCLVFFVEISVVYKSSR